jgi:hypothetical protein
MVAFNDIMFIPEFIEIRSALLEFNHADRWTDRNDEPKMRSLGANRAKNAYKGTCS